MNRPRSPWRLPILMVVAGLSVVPAVAADKGAADKRAADGRADEWKNRGMRGRPPSVPRRIVAAKERLYATLSHEGPLELLDPATGETLDEIEGTGGTQEIALVDRTLVLRLATWTLREKPYVYPGVFKRNYDDFATNGVLRGPMGTRHVGRHLFSTAGFLDDSWFNRTFWMYAETWPGFQIANLAAKTGQILVVDRTTTYAVQAFPGRQGLSPLFVPADKGYLLIADSNDNEPVLDHRTAHRDKGMGFTRAAPPKWHQWVPVRIRAMVAAGGTLFTAGPPDVLAQSDPLAAFEGRAGGLLLAHSTADGKTLLQRKLEAPPVFDGLIAASGQLFLCTTDGRVVCLGER